VHKVALAGPCRALAAAGTLAQINPVWLFGSFNPANDSAGAQPDWYAGLAEGAIRLMPGWETVAAGHTVAWNVLVPAVLMPLGFVAAITAGAVLLLSGGDDLIALHFGVPLFDLAWFFRARFLPAAGLHGDAPGLPRHAAPGPAGTAARGAGRKARRAA
jgi:hypothetical protein